MANLSIIRELCKEKNISLKKLGEEIGIKTPQGVQRMINENSTTIDRLEKIAKLLEVPIWRFFDPNIEMAYIQQIEQQKNRNNINEETLEQMTKIIEEMKRTRENIKTVTYFYLSARELVALDLIESQHYEVMNHLLLDFLTGAHDNAAVETFINKMTLIMNTRKAGDNLVFKGIKRYRKRPPDRTNEEPK